MAERIRAGLEEYRKFGKGLAIILGVFALLSLRRHPGRFPYYLAACMASGSLCAAWPAAFAPLYAVWMPIAEKLAAVNLYLLTGAIYFGVLTPYAVVLRLLGQDLLDEKLGGRDSYWEPHEAEGGRERHERMS